MARTIEMDLFKMEQTAPKAARWAHGFVHVARAGAVVTETGAGKVRVTFRFDSDRPNEVAEMLRENGAARSCYRVAA